MPAPKGSPAKDEPEPEDDQDEQDPRAAQLEAELEAADAQDQAEHDAIDAAAVVYEQHSKRLEQYAGLLGYLLPANGFPVEPGSDVSTNASAIENLDRTLRSAVRRTTLTVLSDIRRIATSGHLEADR